MVAYHIFEIPMQINDEIMHLYISKFLWPLENDITKFVECSLQRRQNWLLPSALQDNLLNTPYETFCHETEL